MPIVGLFELHWWNISDQQMESPTIPGRVIPVCPPLFFPVTICDSRDIAR
jgi:hypothetical protein